MYTIDELESIVTDGSNAFDITDIVDQLLDTMRQNARLRTALEWYANDENYMRGLVHINRSEVDDDNGKRAHTALKGDE